MVRVIGTTAANATKNRAMISPPASPGTKISSSTAEESDARKRRYRELLEILPEGVGAWDRSVASWFVAQRTATLNSATEVGSMLGSTFVVIGIALVIGIVLAFGRHWLAIGFLAAGLLIEVGAFLAATFAVSRPRPDVPQLDVAPPTSSFPSAAALPEKNGGMIAPGWTTCVS